MFSSVKRSQQSPNILDFAGVFMLEGLGEKMLFESTVNKLSVSWLRQSSIIKYELPLVAGLFSNFFCSVNDVSIFSKRS